MEWKKINIDKYHKHFYIFLKAIKMDKLQYKGNDSESMIIKKAEIIKRIKYLFMYKIVVEFQDENQSCFDVYEKITKG